MRAKDIENIQANLWETADILRTNSSLASNEYFMPIMGLLFLRHAHHRYLAVKPTIEENLPKRGGKTRPLTKEDFSSAGAIFLKPEAHYDELVSLPDDSNRAEHIIAAMESIENDYDNLKGVLPKSEYYEIENDVLGEIIRILDPDDLKNVEGDVFGRIYEYFLTRFAGAKAHDDGEFFTPISLVSFISKIIEVNNGVMIDPTCGSGGMFVQSARLIEAKGDDPSEKLTFLGTEKNATTIRFAKMNLAVHGLEGDIKQANSYYKDPHKIVGKADGLMANPPFNPDDIDASKIKKDKQRLHFGLPSVNKKGKITTAGGNYVWISYFYSYLKKKGGRGGFVMAASAAGAGKNEAEIRKNIINTGDIHAIVAIAGGFFYTRPLPCDLWFIDRGRPNSRKTEVLMIDARQIYTEKTSTIKEFTPEQENNLLAINWLYKKEEKRYLHLLEDYIHGIIANLSVIKSTIQKADKSILFFLDALQKFLEGDLDDSDDKTKLADILATSKSNFKSMQRLRTESLQSTQVWLDSHEFSRGMENNQLVSLIKSLYPIANQFSECLANFSELYQNMSRARAISTGSLDAKSSERWDGKVMNKHLELIEYSLNDMSRVTQELTSPLSNAIWLTEKFPDATYKDVLGLCKIANLEDIKKQNYSLSPGRYVGVSPEPLEKEEVVKETLQKISTELRSLSDKSSNLMEEALLDLEERYGE